MSVNDIHILSYCAGMFDADGCFTMYEQQHKGSAKYPYMTGQAVIEIRDEVIVDLFMKHFGGLKQYKQRKNTNHSNTFVWKVTGPALDNFIMQIHPYLLLKHEQAGLLMKMRQIRAGKTTKPITEAEYADLVACKERMRQLNKTGVGKFSTANLSHRNATQQRNNFLKTVTFRVALQLPEFFQEPCG